MLRTLRKGTSLPSFRGMSMTPQPMIQALRNFSQLPQDRPDWEQGEEPLADYDHTSVNTYCPVNIGDTIGSHRVFRKVGWGGYSTVWLGETQR